VSRPTVDDLASFLRGSWRIDRDILACGRTTVGRFTGTGTFAVDAAAPGLLRYQEHGTLQFGTHEAPASRRLGYHVAGGRAEVVFADGRPFHDLDLRAGSHDAEHACGDDLYRGRFEVVSDHSWFHEWSVVGPRKDHLIRTTLDRRR
jgi:hypothetical protein